MTYSHNNDSQLFFMNMVDNPVITYPEPVKIGNIFQLLRPMREKGFREGDNLRVYAHQRAFWKRRQTTPCGAR